MIPYLFLLPPRFDLAEPAAVEAITSGHSIEAGLQWERDVVAEEELRPGAEGVPLCRAVLWIAVACPLVDEERHNGELGVRLDQKVLLD